VEHPTNDPSDHTRGTGSGGKRSFECCLASDQRDSEGATTGSAAADTGSQASSTPTRGPILEGALPESEPVVKGWRDGGLAPLYGKRADD
jgi:hypothetical protein